MRTVISEAFGRETRFSGIRDPRRRLSQAVMLALHFVFIFRYSVPKFMNLEAGNDWKARLVGTMNGCRCAVVDLRDVTPFVQDEVQIAVACLGFDRILFVIDDQHMQGHFVQLITDVVPVKNEHLSHIRFARWSSDVDAFRSELEGFKEQLPEKPARVTLLPFLQRVIADAQEASFHDRRDYRGPFVFWVLAIVSGIILIFDPGWVLLLCSLPLYMWWTIEFWKYLVEIDSVGKRVASVLAFCIGFALSSIIVELASKS